MPIIINRPSYNQQAIQQPLRDENDLGQFGEALKDTISTLGTIVTQSSAEASKSTAEKELSQLNLETSIKLGELQRSGATDIEKQIEQFQTEKIADIESRNANVPFFKKMFNDNVWRVKDNLSLKAKEAQLNSDALLDANNRQVAIQTNLANIQLDSNNFQDSVQSTFDLVNNSNSMTLKERLDTKYGVMILQPAYTKYHLELGEISSYPPGYKENAGIFNHTQGWGIIAETMLGNGDRAYEYCKAAIPAAYNDKAEIRQSEPYVVGQTTYSTFSKRPGNTRVSWLSGAGTWSYYAITQYMLGIKPQYEGLLIDPCIKSDWDGYKVERRWRKMNLKIEVKNPQHVCKGVEYMEVDGKRLDSAVIPVEMLKDGSNVVVYMGKNSQPVPVERV